MSQSCTNAINKISPIIDYRTKLADYLRTQKEIAENFFAAAAAAEETCEHTTRTAITNREQDAAQAVFKSQLRDARDVRNVALKALGPPPVMPSGHESCGISHETHNIEPYVCEQEQIIASLEKHL